MAIVCQCIPVRDRAVIKAIHGGASTLADIRAACGAATLCFGCEPAIEMMLEQHCHRVTELGLPRTSSARA